MELKTMVQTPKQKNQTYSQKQKDQGRKKRSVWLDAEEFIQVKMFVEKLRLNKPKN